jgi:hypothetical protein
MKNIISFLFPEKKKIPVITESYLSENESEFSLVLKV